MTHHLIPPAPPEAVAAETTPLADLAWLAVTLRDVFAPLRAVVGYCPTCGAVGTERCRDGGRFVRRHGGRA